ncbi:hypothetical protein HN827_01750 [archaeon]|nr:hypothetical protein [archaeon]
MRKNKKSTVYTMFIFSLLIVVVIVPYAFIRATKVKNKFDNFIGESQIHILKTYEKGEKTLFYVDESAKFSFNNLIIKNIRENIINSNCRKIGDFYILYDEFSQEECKLHFNIEEENIMAEFHPSFKEKLNNFGEKIPEINYEYSLNDKMELIGLTNDKIHIEINPDYIIRIKNNKKLTINEIQKDIANSFESADKDTPELIGYYQINPSFRINLNFDPNQMIQSLNKLYNEINSKGVNDIEEVLRSNQDYKKMNLCNNDIDSKNLIKICVDTGLYEESKSSLLNKQNLKKFTLKFAMIFN